MDSRVVLITIGTCGIGAAFAWHFSGKRFDLIISGHPEDKVYPCVKNLADKYNVKVEIIPAELSNAKVVSKIENPFRINKHIKILTNNAGFGLPNLFWKHNINNLENMVKVHIIAPLRFINDALTNMMNKRKETKINLPSLAYYIPIPSDSVYSANKLFQNSLIHSLYISLKEVGIKILVLCPGFVQTDFHKNLSTVTVDMKKREIISYPVYYQITNKYLS